MSNASSNCSLDIWNNNTLLPTYREVEKSICTAHRRKHVSDALPLPVLHAAQYNNNNNNNNKHDNVYGAVIMAEPLREFTRFIW